MVKLWKMH